MDGRPGSPGAAGSIVVSVDPEAQGHLGVLQLTNKSGAGAAGRPPEIRVEPVAPLWSVSSEP